MSFLLQIYNNLKLKARTRRIVDRGHEKLPNIRRFNSIVERINTYVLSSAQKILLQRSLTLCDRFQMGAFARTNQRMSGDLVLNNLMKGVHEFTLCSPPLKARRNQMKMIAYIFAAFLPLIYGESLTSEQDRLLALLGIDKIREEIVILAARREGKSFCIGIAIALVLIYIPASVGAIFSINMRASKRLQLTIKSCLSKHPIGKKMLDRAIVDNFEFIRLVGDHPSHIKDVQLFPDKSTVCFLFFFLDKKKWVIVINQHQYHLQGMSLLLLLI